MEGKELLIHANWGMSVVRLSTDGTTRPQIHNAQELWVNDIMMIVVAYS